MPSLGTAKLSAKKGASGFTSKTPSKDASSNEQPNGNGTKKMKGRRKIRSQKRAWRWRIPKEEPIEDGCAKCQYVSRRIGIACNNIRPHSKLSSMGLCERHTQFAQQLKALFVAEQGLSDQGDFIAHRIDEDGMLSISDDDETLSATFDWPCAEENLHYDPSYIGKYCSLLANTEAVTEKELLICRLAALESKMAAIKEYREVLAEKQRRYEAYLMKEILEEDKKGKLVAETRKEKRQMRTLRASKRYGRWRNWKASKQMRQQLEARLKITAQESATDTGPETQQLDYLDVEFENEEQRPICSFVYADEDGSYREDECEARSGDDNSKGNESDRCRELKGRRCENVALPSLNYCMQHVFENSSQQMFAACLECGAAALDLDDGDHYCSAHISMKNADRKKLYGPLEVKTSFDYSATSTPPSSIRASLDSTSNLAPPSEVAEQITSENLLTDKEESSTLEGASDSHRTVTPTQLSGLALMLNDVELKGSNIRVLYDEEGPNAPPVQIVLIDDEEDGGQGKTTQQSKEEECTVVNVVQRHSSTPAADPTFGVDSLGIVAARRALVTPRKKVDDGNTQSAARTRPFIPTFFPHSDSISKHRKQPNLLTNTVVSPQRYITIEQRTHTEEGLGPSQMTVQKLRTGGPYLHTDIQKYSPRTASTPSNSNLMPSSSIIAPTSARSMNISTGYHPSTSISRLTDPNTISLSSSPITQLSQPVSQPKRSAFVQRNAAAIIRGRQMLTSQLLRQNSTSSPVERPSYSMAGSSSSVQRWRPQRSSTVAGSGLMQNSYRYSKIDANDRMLHQRDYDDYYYRPRETKTFNLSGSARSRLVPVDPSPTMYYVRPQYQTYTPLSLSRPVRRYQQEGESVRRVSLPREVDRQQLQETAAAVASIASLSEHQSPGEQHQGSEQPTESTIRQSNVLPAAPQLKSQKQEMEQPAPKKSMLAESQVIAAPNPSNEPQLDEDASSQRMQASRLSQESDRMVEGNTSAGALSRKYCIENAEDGLAVLAMAAASHAAAIDHHQFASSGDSLKADDMSNPSSSTLPLSTGMQAPESVVESAKSVESMTAMLEPSDKLSPSAPQGKRPQKTNFGLEMEDSVIEPAKGVESSAAILEPNDMSSSSAPQAKRPQITNFGLEMEDSVIEPAKGVESSAAILEPNDMSSPSAPPAKRPQISTFGLEMEDSVIEPAKGVESSTAILEPIDKPSPSAPQAKRLQITSFGLEMEDSVIEPAKGVESSAAILEPNDKPSPSAPQAKRLQITSFGLEMEDSVIEPAKGVESSAAILEPNDMSSPSAPPAKRPQITSFGLEMEDSVIEPAKGVESSTAILEPNDKPSPSAPQAKRPQVTSFGLEMEDSVIEPAKSVGSSTAILEPNDKPSPSAPQAKRPQITSFGLEMEDSMIEPAKGVESSTVILELNDKPSPSAPQAKRPQITSFGLEMEDSVIEPAKGVESSTAILEPNDKPSPSAPQAKRPQVTSFGLEMEDSVIEPAKGVESSTAILEPNDKPSPSAPQAKRPQITSFGLEMEDSITEPAKSVESSTAILQPNDNSSPSAPQVKRPQVTSFGLEMEDSMIEPVKGVESSTAILEPNDKPSPSAPQAKRPQITSFGLEMEDSITEPAKSVESSTAILQPNDNSSPSAPQVKRPQVTSFGLEMEDSMIEPVKGVESSTAMLEPNDKSSPSEPQAKRPRISNFGLEMEDEEY